MQLFSWRRQRATGQPPDLRCPARLSARRFRPHLEALEARDVPSTLTVTNNLDSGTGSLRAEIAAANNNDTIAFAPSLNGQTIALTTGELAITKSLTIQGPGAGLLAISGGNTWRVFEVSGTSTGAPNVLLSGLTITSGNGRGGPVDGDGGGGVLNRNGSTLTISGCTLSNNSAFLAGGAVSNFLATLNLVNSTLSGNGTEDSQGGGKGGAVYSIMGPTVSITGCTLTNNFAASGGGAIYTVSTTMTVSGCTFSGNVEPGASFGLSVPSIGNDIYNGGVAKMLNVKDSAFSNNTPWRFSPIEGPWTNKGGNTFK